jgi:hypothetical protein
MRYFPFLFSREDVAQTGDGRVTGPLISHFIERRPSGRKRMFWLARQQCAHARR